MIELYRDLDNEIIDFDCDHEHVEIESLDYGYPDASIGSNGDYVDDWRDTYVCQDCGATAPVSAQDPDDWDYDPESELYPLNENYIPREEREKTE